jgi:hypothetical protein
MHCVQVERKLSERCSNRLAAKFEGLFSFLSNMAPLKKNNRKEGLTLKRVKGENHYRDAKAASRLKMLNSGKPVYDRDGKIKQAAAFQKGEDETTPGRVQPDRRWFGMPFIYLLFFF